MKEGDFVAKSIIEEWATSEKLLLLEAWARDGLTDEQIAEKIGINVRTLYNWKNKDVQIFQALKRGKEVVDIEVENALYKKAVGFKETVKKPIKVKRVDYVDGKRDREYEEVVDAEEEVFIPPDTIAQIFWLKNRKPEKWRDKPETDRADSTAEMLKNAQTLAEILRHPVPDRDIADFE